MATADPSKGVSTASKGAVHLNGTYGVLRAGRVETAAGRAPRRRSLVQVDQDEEQPGNRAGARVVSGAHAAASCTRPSCVACSVRSAVTSPAAAAAAGPRATRTTSKPSRHAISRAASRNSRLERLRCTAPPTRRDATTAIRDSAPSARSRACTTRRRPARRVLASKTAWMSRVARNRSTVVTAPAVSVSGRQLGATLAATRLDDRAAGTRLHASTESVLAGATTVVRLKGPLHGSPPGGWCRNTRQT